MSNNDLENQLECPYCQGEALYRPMHPQGNPHQGGGNMPPMGPPPPMFPSQYNMQAQPKAVEPGTIKPCTYRYVYIYPNRGRAYWAWLTYVGRKSASGYKWTGRNWVYFWIDLREIKSFYCY